MENLIAPLSNAMHIVFLCGMIYAALIRLTDGNREHFLERISLVLVALGAFAQITKAAHPSGTSFEVNITHLGVAMWMILEVYKLKYKVRR
jgi:hypothetical protein